MCSDIERALATTVQYIYLYTIYLQHQSYNLIDQHDAKLHTCRLAVNIAQIIYAQRLFVGFRTTLKIKRNKTET